ncbi:hypothetical protein TWF281_003159 [Arthrobotrys megalospora]
MPRTRGSGTTFGAAFLCISWLSVTDAYYFAALRSSTTQPQGIPTWGWQPLGDGTDMQCKPGGSEEAGWLQAFGVINHQTPPPNLPNGNAQGFIFYSDANCQLAQSDKVLYVKFDELSTSPQVVNFRNLAWETDVETSISLADNKYRSYREVRDNNAYVDPDLQTILPTLELPATYVYPAEQYPNDQGQPSWGGEIMAQGVTRLNVIPAQQGLVANPGITIFDALLSLMSGIGQDLATQQQLLQLADPSIGFPNMGVAPPVVGTQRTTPSKMLELSVQNIDRPIQNANPVQNPATGMNIEAQGPNTMARVNIPLYGDTNINQPINTRRRAGHPFFAIESESASPQTNPATEEALPLNLNDYILGTEFVPNRIVASVMTRWGIVLQDNERVRQMARNTNIENLDEETRFRLTDAIDAMRSGMEWVENLQLITENLITAQRRNVEYLDDIEEQYGLEWGTYQETADEIQALTVEYENTFIPTQAQTARYNALPAEARQALELYEGGVATLEQRAEELTSDLRQNEQDYYEEYVRTFLYLRNLEIWLRTLRSELGLDSPTLTYGLSELENGPGNPNSYNEQIQPFNLSGAQNYEEHKEGSEEGEGMEYEEAMEASDVNQPSGANLDDSVD